MHAIYDMHSHIVCQTHYHGGHAKGIEVWFRTHPNALNNIKRLIININPTLRTLFVLQLNMNKHTRIINKGCKKNHKKHLYSKIFYK